MSTLLFGWMTPALLAGAKTAIRCSWSKQTAARFRAGQVVDAYDRPTRSGGRWLYEHVDTLAGTRYRNIVRRDDFSPAAFERWRSRPLSAWVLRFKVLEVFAAPDETSLAGT